MTSVRVSGTMPRACQQPVGRNQPSEASFQQEPRPPGAAFRQVDVAPTLPLWQRVPMGLGAPIVPHGFGPSEPIAANDSAAEVPAALAQSPGSSHFDGRRAPGTDPPGGAIGTAGESPGVFASRAGNPGSCNPFDR